MCCVDRFSAVDEKGGYAPSLLVTVRFKSVMLTGLVRWMRREAMPPVY